MHRLARFGLPLSVAALLVACANGAATKDTSPIDAGGSGGEDGEEEEGGSGGKGGKSGGSAKGGTSGKGGTAAKGGEAGTSGDAGKAGSAPTKGGAAGDAGTSGKGGAAGTPSKGGAAGDAGKGGTSGGSAGSAGKGGSSGGGTAGKGGGSGTGGSGSGTLSSSLSRPSPNAPVCNNEGAQGTCAVGLVCRIYSTTDGRCEGCSPCEAIGKACTASVGCSVTAQCFAGFCRELCPLASGTCATPDTTCKDVGNDAAGVCLQ